MIKRWLPVVVIGLALAALVAIASPLASSDPDGLEKVAEDKEFAGHAEDSSYNIIPDYAFPGIENEAVATILSGLIGVAIVAALGFGVAFLMRAGRPKDQPTNNPGSS